jgi:uncharacterized repeat protein (TIGR01451 family)
MSKMTRIRKALILAAGILLLFIASYGVVQASHQSQTGALWQDFLESSLPPNAERLASYREGRTLRLNLPAIQALLAAAPMETDPDRDSRLLTLPLPMPDGSLQRFAVYESPIMASELAARYPQIKTYAGQGLDDPTASTRLDLTPHGFHAIILTPQGTIYIDPLLKSDITYYASYFKKDYLLRVGDVFIEEQLADELRAALPQAVESLQPAASGTELHTYRLALAATGEYTIYHGGTVEDGLAAQVIAMNRVNFIYETEVAIRMVLIANNTDIIYTDPETDPYTNDNPTKLLTENKNNLNEVIGVENFDIGHVFSTGGGGIAMLAVPCNDMFKAEGVTGISNPIGDAFYVDYVAHEMGHQWGANHTYNGDAGACATGRSATTAYEPGSASTIMSYAGICGDQDLQEHSDAYFHPISIDEIVYYTTVGGGTECGVTTSTGNNPPEITSGSGGYTIPVDTPFTLTGSAADPDGDELTYAWDEMDLGPAGPPPPLPDYVVPPYFRSFNATATPSRTFPRMVDIVNNVNTIGEILPLIERELNFRLTARDNRVGGGGVNSDSYVIYVTDDAGPFLVTAPNEAVSWLAGSTQTVIWDVANTTAAPVNCSDVSLDLSTDGGYTYPISLLASTPNDGTEEISVPGIPTTTARVRVACLSNIFFDISNTDFTILAPDLTVSMAHSGELIAGQPITFTITVSNVGSGPSGGMITVTDTLPASLTAASLSGTGWDCDISSLTCTNENSLETASNLPVITLVANASLDVPLLVVNTAMVSGGGDNTPENNIAQDAAGYGWKVFVPTLLK